jgi:hypothetical protein
MTILTASTEKQYASEQNGSGVFTTLFVDALDGAASNIVGEITPGSVYAHIDQSLGAWEQRPVFKTNVTEFVSLRTVPRQSRSRTCDASRSSFQRRESNSRWIRALKMI